MPQQGRREIRVPEVLYREFRVRAESLDEESRTVELTFSSETPVTEWLGVEILDHSKRSSARLDRLNNGAALLYNHNRDALVGVVESAEIDTAAKVGRATVRFAKTPFAEEKFQQVKDGILTKVSCGCLIRNAKVEVTTKDGQPDMRRYFGWEPFEISLVTVPADDAVGVSRNHNEQGDNMPLRYRTILLDPNPADGGGGNSGQQSDPPTPTPTPPSRDRQQDPSPPQPGRADAGRDERIRRAEVERTEAIIDLGQRHNVPVDRVREHIRNQSTLEAFQNWLLREHIRARPIDLDPNIGMSDREVRQYSLVRALNVLGNNRPLDGIEREASDAVAKKLRRDPQGFFVPNDVASRSLAAANQDIGLRQLRVIEEMVRQNRILANRQRSLSASIATAGGYLVGVDVLGSDMIELLRNKALVGRLGARMLGGLMGDVAIPKQSGGATAYWLDETSELSTSDQSFGQLALKPKRLGGGTGFSKQLLAQASIDVEAFVREDLMTVLAVEKDRAAINGSGAAGEPLGLMNTTGIGAVTFGAAATRAKAIEFQSDVAAANASQGALAYLTDPLVAGAWMGIEEATGTAQWLWKGNIDEGVVVGRPALSTNQVPSQKVIYGNWNDLIIADWDGLDVVVDPYTLAAFHQVRVIVHMLTDCGLRHAASFSVSTDAGNQ